MMDVGKERRGRMEFRTIHSRRAIWNSDLLEPIMK